MVNHSISVKIIWSFSLIFSMGYLKSMINLESNVLYGNFK
uniref:Uncharacterized protein n=1 Tax=Arundo donax TaxID=35708 RepID=A0A0A9TP02_ARUDO